jgi:hypothetical protein
MTKIKIRESLNFPKIKLKYMTPQARTKAKGGISKGMMNSRTIIKTSLSEALQRSLKASVWSWPNKTHRQNGSIVGTIRDIYDTGKLYRSQKVVSRYSGGVLGFAISYSAPYAYLVHYGGAQRPYGDVTRPLRLLPGRPWVYATVKGTHGIEKYDLNRHLSAAIKQEWLARFNPSQ